MTEREQKLRAVLDGFGVSPVDAHAPLDLPSLTVVALVEELEAAFGFVVAARELRADNFGTLAALIAFVEKKR